MNPLAIEELLSNFFIFLKQGKQATHLAPYLRGQPSGPTGQEKKTLPTQRPKASKFSQMFPPRVEPGWESWWNSGSPLGELLSNLSKLILTNP